MSLRTRLFGFFAGLTILMVVGSTFVVDRVFRRTNTIQIRQEFSGATLQVNLLQSKSIEALLSLTATISADARLRGSLSTRDRATILAAAIETNSTYATDLFWVLDARGQVLAKAEKPEDWGDAVLNRGAVRDAIEGFDSADIWSIDGLIYQVAAVPIFSGSKPLGILVVGESFEKGVLHDFPVLTGLEMALFDGDSLLSGTFAGSHPEWAKELRRIAEKLRFEEPDSVLPPIPPLTKGDVSTGPFHMFRLHGEPFAGSRFLLQTVRGEPLATGLAFRSLRAEQALARRIEVALLAVGVTAVLMGLVAAFLLARKLTRPINRLVEASNRLGSGDLDNAIPAESKDEIGTLAHALDEMRTSLKIAREELIKGERLSTVGRMASSIIHDFRQPMSAIYGMMQLITMPEFGPEKREEYRDRVLRQVDRMLAMINELLDFAKGEIRLNPMPVSLSTFVEEILLVFEREARERSIRIFSDLKWDGTINIDQGRVQRGVENIIRNAVQAIGMNGQVAIESSRQNGFVSLCIRDNGPGIPEEIRGHLFEAFVSHGKKEGTGLGLAVAKKVIEEHGGVIDVESESGKGTTFRIQLPLAESKGDPS